MNTGTEDRLLAAMNARTDQVTPESLSPRELPAVPSPLRRRRRSVLGPLAAAAAVATIAGVGVATLGDDDAGRVPAGTSPTSPTLTDPTSETPPTGRPIRGLLPEDDPALIEPGREVRIGASRVELTEDRRIVVRFNGQEQSATLPDAPGSPRLYDVAISLGQAGEGYVVQSGEADAGDVEWWLFVPSETGLQLADGPADVPFGTGFAEDESTYATWSSSDGFGLFTRVQVGDDPSQQRFRVFRWEVTGPGEGGGETNLERDRVATDLGIACFDFESNTARRC